MKAIFTRWALYLRALLLVFAVGCGAATTEQQDTAQAFLTATTRGVEKSDEVVAERYTAAADVALREVESMEAFGEAMRPWDRAEAALVGARSSLLAAQAGLDVWVDTGNDVSFKRVAACLVGKLGALATAVEAAGLELPDTLQTAIGLGASFAQGRCEEGATP